jgi:hypothetical protein
LKDSSGKIVLDVPIQGSLDDPKFRIGKVVMRVIGNILEKVATSPFSLLGAMFGGGGEELSYQDFNPGRAELSPADLKKLDSLAKAMNARPGLELEITGSVVPDTDRSGLQLKALDRDIRTRVWQQMRDADRATNSADQIVVSPTDQAVWVQKLFQDAVATGSIPSAAIAADTNLAAVVAEQSFTSNQHSGQVIKTGASLANHNPVRALTTQSPSLGSTNSATPPDPMTGALLGTYPISQSDLATLAANRAHVVQDYLSQTGKVAATRLFLTAQAATLNTNGTRAYLKFR